VQIKKLFLCSIFKLYTLVFPLISLYYPDHFVFKHVSNFVSAPYLKIGKIIDADLQCSCKQWTEQSAGTKGTPAV